jgi:hypothetical protein
MDMVGLDIQLHNLAFEPFGMGDNPAIHEFTEVTSQDAVAVLGHEDYVKLAVPDHMR